MVFLIRRGLSVVVFKVKKLVREIKEVMPRDNRLARRGRSALKRTRKERYFRDFWCDVRGSSSCLSRDERQQPRTRRGKGVLIPVHNLPHPGATVVN